MVVVAAAPSPFSFPSSMALDGLEQGSLADQCERKQGSSIVSWQLGWVVSITTAQIESRDHLTCSEMGRSVTEDP